MVAGAPRTVTPEYDELVKLGEELLLWATADIPKKERPYRFRFAQWYSLVKGISDKQWEYMTAKPEFKGYYERARVALANRITDGSIKEGIAHRFMRTYCPEVKREEDDKFKDEESFKSKLKSQELAMASDDDIKRHQETLDQIKALRSERNIDKSNIKDEHKSA